MALHLVVLNNAGGTQLSHNAEAVVATFCLPSCNYYYLSLLRSRLKHYIELHESLPKFPAASHLS